MWCLMVLVGISIIAMMYAAFNFDLYKGLKVILPIVSVLTTVAIFYIFYLSFKYVLNFDKEIVESEDVGNILMSFVYNGKKHIKIVS